MIFYIKKIKNLGKDIFFFFNLKFLKIFLTWRNYLSSNDLINLFKLSLKPIRIKKIKVEKIYFFFDKVNYIKERKFFKNNDLKVLHSPQVKFLKSFNKRSINNINRSDIFKFYMSKKKKINFFNHTIIKLRPSKLKTLKKINRLKKIYESIKTNGYLKGEYSKCYPCVIKGGFNYKFDKNFNIVPGYEIFIGHRRISSLVALGQKKIKVIEIEKL